MTSGTEYSDDGVPLPMGRDAFERLPPQVREETLRKLRADHLSFQCAVAKRAALARQMAVLGAITAGVLSVTVVANPVFFVLNLITGAAGGYAIGRHGLHQIYGVLIFGFGIVFLTVVFFLLDFAAIRGNTGFMFFGWIFYCVAGMLLAWTAKSKFEKLDG